MKRIRVQDPLLFIFALAATMIGLLLIFDSGYARSIMGDDGWIPREFRNQALFSALAIGIGLAFGRIGEATWRKAARWIALAVFGLLVLVKFVGHQQGGAHSWIQLPFGATLQPAEFAKFAAILYLAAALAGRKPWVERSLAGQPWDIWGNRLLEKIPRLWPAFAVLAAVIMIALDPDLGTAAIIAVTAFGMGYVGGANRWTLAAFLAMGALGAGLFLQKEAYRMDRVSNHVHRWEDRNVQSIGWQTVQSEVAMASGGLAGVGPGSGRAKTILPATTNDFILATAAEEFGIFGSLAVIGSLGLIVWRLFALAVTARSQFGKLVLQGTAVWIGVQTVTNVLMANGTLPAIGVPLPFISSGGSSLIALWMAVGVCQAVLGPAPAREVKSAARGYRRRDGRAYLPGA